MARYEFCSSRGNYAFRCTTVGNVVVEIFSGVRPIVTSVEIRHNQKNVAVVLASAGDWALPTHLREGTSMSRGSEGTAAILLPFTGTYQDHDLVDAVLTCLEIPHITSSLPPNE